jgi:hypothetical protein
MVDPVFIEVSNTHGIEAGLVTTADFKLKSEFRNPKSAPRTKVQNQWAKTIHMVRELIPLKFLAFPEFRIRNFGVRVQGPQDSQLSPYLPRLTNPHAPEASPNEIVTGIGVSINRFSRAMLPRLS